MDTDKDGSLSKEEIERASTKLGENFGTDTRWEAIINKCDLDGDGRIDF